eukprot:m.185850 g.185850  ORF g.185850 m.185850 type:complete len:403 (-) comp10522_c0_seq1:250-1458(-)
MSSTLRPGTSKLHPDAWHSQNSRITTAAQTQRNTAQQVRQTARDLTRATTSHLQRTQREVQNQLALRLDEIENQKQALFTEVDEVEAEIQNLTIHRQLLEKEIADMKSPLDITRECMRLRDERQGVDLVDDAVDKVLSKEEHLLEHSAEELRNKLDEVNEQLRLLRSARFQLEEDLQDKDFASQIDRTCTELDVTSRNVDFFNDSAKVDSRAVLPDDWHVHTTDNQRRAAQQRANSVQLREDIDALLKSMADRIALQRNAVDDAFNRRIAEYHDSIKAAQQHLTKTQVEIQSQETCIQELEDTIEARMAPLKVAQTRLQKRSERPNVELVRDSAHTSLLKEVSAIEDTIEQLRSQLSVADASLRSLNRAALQLEEDLAIKTNSLNLENRCMQLRQEFKYRTI